MTCVPSTCRVRSAQAISSLEAISSMRMICPGSGSPTRRAILRTILSEVPRMSTFLFCDPHRKYVNTRATTRRCIVFSKSATRMAASSVLSCFAERPAIILSSRISNPSSITNAISKRRITICARKLFPLPLLPTSAKTWRCSGVPMHAPCSAPARSRSPLSFCLCQDTNTRIRFPHDS